MVLKTEIKSEIEHDLKLKNRKNKNEIFQAISDTLKVCDFCPFNKDAIGAEWIAKEAEEPFEVVCANCTNYKKLRNLGEKVEDKNRNVETLLSKGKDLKKEEVYYLLEMGAQKKEVQHALGMDHPRDLNLYIRKSYDPNLFEEKKVERSRLL